MKVYKVIILIMLCSVIECKRKRMTKKTQDKITGKLIGQNRLFRRVMKDDLLDQFKNNINLTLTSKDGSYNFVKKFLAVTLTLSPLQLKKVVAKVIKALNKWESNDTPFLDSIKKEMASFNLTGEHDKLETIFRVWYVLNNVKDETGVFKQLGNMFELKDPIRINKNLNSILKGRKSKLSRTFTEIVNDVNFLGIEKNKSDSILTAIKSGVSSLTSAPDEQGQTFRRRASREKRHLLTDFLIDLCSLAYEISEGAIFYTLQAVDVNLLNFFYSGSMTQSLFKSARERTSYYNIISSLGSSPAEIHQNIVKFKSNLLGVKEDPDFKPVVNYLSVYDDHFSDNHGEEQQTYFNVIYKDLNNVLDHGGQHMETLVAEFIREIIFKTTDRLSMSERDNLSDILEEIAKLRRN